MRLNPYQEVCTMQQPRTLKDRKGFTMIELMVVVVIAGVLAAIAIPIYGKYIKNARISEAHGRIGEIVTSVKVHAQENQDAAGVPQWPSTATGIVDLSATENFTYAIDASAGSDATDDDFVITATGIAGSKMAGVTVSITLDDINSSGSAPTVAGL
jgi:type IV pilus assembly protein PilA